MVKSGEVAHFLFWWEMGSQSVGDVFEWEKEGRTEAEVAVEELILEEQCCQAMWSYLVTA